MFDKSVRVALGSNAIKAMLAGAAAVAILTAGVSDGSAKERRPQSQNQSWQDANAAVAPSRHSGRTFSGVASHYGYEAGSKTASGQRLNANAMTAAHRSLPFGTRVRVTHRDRSVVVTINDRGPFVRGRVLDLTTGAARALGFRGLGKVTAEVL
jgi:rare lipoprotein A